MIARLIHWSIGNRFLVLLATLFISALGIIHLGALDRITGIPQLQELGAFNNTTFFDVETGDDALR